MILGSSVIIFTCMLMIVLKWSQKCSTKDQLSEIKQNKVWLKHDRSVTYLNPSITMFC